MSIQESINQAKELLSAIKESKINNFDCENQTRFLESFEGSAQYCIDAINTAEVWEKKEFKKVLESNLNELQETQDWFNSMKKYGLA